MVGQDLRLQAPLGGSAQGASHGPLAVETAALFPGPCSFPRVLTVLRALGWAYFSILQAQPHCLPVPIDLPLAAPWGSPPLWALSSLEAMQTRDSSGPPSSPTR